MFNSMFTMKKTIETAAQKASDTFQFMMQEYRQELESQGVLSDLAEYLQDDSAMLRQKGEQKMLAVVKRYTILLDTCAIVHSNFPLMMENMLPMLKENRKQVLVPASVISEMRKLGTRDMEMRETVRKACGLLMTLQQQGVLRILNGDNPDFGDQDIYTFATKNRMTMDLLIITHDANLSKDLVKLNDMMSVNGRRIKVCRMNRHGFLSGYRTPEEQAELAAGLSADKKPAHAEKPAAPARRVVSPAAETHVKQSTAESYRLETCIDCGIIVHNAVDIENIKSSSFLGHDSRLLRADLCSILPVRLVAVIFLGIVGSSNVYTRHRIKLANSE